MALTEFDKKPTAERYIESLWKRVDERGKTETLREVLEKEVRELVWAGQRMRENFFARCGKMDSIKRWDALVSSRDRD